MQLKTTHKAPRHLQLTTQHSATQTACANHPSQRNFKRCDVIFTTFTYWSVPSSLDVLVKELGWVLHAPPGGILVSRCVRYADNIESPPSVIVVTSPSVIIVPRVVVIVVVSASVIPSIYVGSTLIWIDASSALKGFYSVEMFHY